jgi:hypothetical protein
MKVVDAAGAAPLRKQKRYTLVTAFDILLKYLLFYCVNTVPIGILLI